VLSIQYHAVYRENYIVHVVYRIKYTVPYHAIKSLQYTVQSRKYKAKIQ